MGGLPAIAFALIFPVIDGQWAFWVPLTIIASLAVMVIIQLYPQWLRGEEMFIAIIVWVAVVMATNGIMVKVAYYEAAAQILPVLFLALVVERRLRVSRRPEIRSRVIVTLLAGRHPSKRRRNLRRPKDLVGHQAGSSWPRLSWSSPLRRASVPRASRSCR